MNNRGAIDPLTAGKAAAAFGIKIYTIGVGTRGMAPVPVARGLFGLRYENRPVEIDESLRTQIAIAVQSGANTYINGAPPAMAQAQKITAMTHANAMANGDP